MKTSWEEKLNISVDEYLKMVTGWRGGNFDNAFDFGFAQAKKQLVAKLADLERK